MAIVLLVALFCVVLIVALALQSIGDLVMYINRDWLEDDEDLDDETPNDPY